MKKGESRILIFACEWIPYTSADNAGVSGLQYPADTRIIRLNCSGRITPAHIIKTFRHEADGVLIAGCDDGECHYLNGNDECKKVVSETKQLMEYIGINPERLRLELFSEMEGEHFSTVVNNFFETLKNLANVGEVAAQ